MIKKLTRLKIPIDFNDCLIITGTALFTCGLWGYDPRAALITLGAWLIFLGRPEGGD